MPVAYSLGLAAILAALWIGLPLEAVMLKTSDGMDDFPLLAIPFFILAGAIMAEGGMAERIVNLAKVFVGFIRGGLALVNILASTMFGCISGSSVADTASIGSVMIPQMIKNGYPRLFAVNVTDLRVAAAAAHSALAQRGDLLAGGGRHGLGRAPVHGRRHSRACCSGLSLMVLCLIIAHRNNFPKGEVDLPCARRSRSPSMPSGASHRLHHPRRHPLAASSRRPNRRRSPASGRSSSPCSSIATTSGASCRCMLGRVVRTVGMVMIMIGFSIAFGYMMAIMRVPAMATEFFVAISDDKYMFLLYVNILLLLLGTFMDLAPMLLICTPIFLPRHQEFGIDPVHFGIIMILNLGIGLLTPPVGPTLAVGCAIGKVSMEAVSRSILIFYIPMLIVLGLVTYIPALTLWLPALLLR